MIMPDIIRGRIPDVVVYMVRGSENRETVQRGIWHCCLEQRSGRSMTSRRGPPSQT